jgi:hypothetical protein
MPVNAMQTFTTRKGDWLLWGWLPEEGLEPVPRVVGRVGAADE